MARSRISETLVVLDARTPLQFTLGTWPQGAGWTCEVAICTQADGRGVVHATLQRLVQASETGELSVAFDPIAAATWLQASLGERLWVVPLLSERERRLAADDWLPLAIRTVSPFPITRTT